MCTSSQNMTSITKRGKGTANFSVIRFHQMVMVSSKWFQPRRILSFAQITWNVAIFKQTFRQFLYFFISKFLISKFIILSLIHLDYALNTRQQHFKQLTIISQQTTCAQLWHVLTCASRNVSESKPCVSWRKPVFIMGRNTPVTATWSPGMACLVTSPLAITVMERGMCPTGTWSLCSWILSSWNLMNFDPRVWRYSRPPALSQRD